MAQIFPFRTEFMHENFHAIISECSQVACDDDDFDATIAPALITGLATCDGAQHDGMTTADIYDVAYTLQIDESNTATIEAFAFGAAIALAQSVDDALAWMLIDEEDYRRAAVVYTNYSGEEITPAQLRDEVVPLEVCMLLLQSYIDVPVAYQGVSHPSAKHPAATL